MEVTEKARQNGRAYADIIAETALRGLSPSASSSRAQPGTTRAKSEPFANVRLCNPFARANARKFPFSILFQNFC